MLLLYYCSIDDAGCMSSESQKQISGACANLQCICRAPWRSFDVGCTAVSNAATLGQCHCLGLLCELEPLGCFIYFNLTKPPILFGGKHRQHEVSDFQTHEAIRIIQPKQCPLLVPICGSIVVRTTQLAMQIHADKSRNL